MLSLNLLPPSNVTVSKSRTRCPINAPLLDPNHVNRTQKHRNASCSSFGFRNSSSSFSHPVCQISKSGLDFGRFLGHPFGVSSRFSSQPLGAAAGAPQESSPDGEIEVSKPNKNLKLAVVFGLCFSLVQRLIKSFIVALLGPALFHTIGHISACVSFSKVAVSFTHVIKSAEPVFSVVFSSFLGDSYPLSVWLSILPIVFGCSLAAVTEVSFNFEGLWGAMISNVGFVLRNIYSKKSLQSFKEVNGLNLYGWISILSLLYLFPVAVFVEGSQWVAGYHKAIATIGKPTTFYLWVMLSGIFYHLYNQSSYEALDDISPLSFSVGNTMKRVVVIIATVLVFRNPVRPLNALGSAIAIFGTFLYSQATAKKPKVEEKKN
ncbi:UNVERIFIED_CONTAM: Xylulose 5-phosphate/phosphate translocator, chloroplastic [Sesamum radiatum]|uniref:Xylulose 5-phosphate/phosphate translocator, chloroplastic n=1 Tax=Sesamum radiatum TaxID=300843 RepID=A0AAW2KTA8_SESRA